MTNKMTTARIVRGTAALSLVVLAWVATAPAQSTTSSTSGKDVYIQNQTTPQADANFNISTKGLNPDPMFGKGTANIFDATTQYDINNKRVLSVAGGGNLFAGVSAGTANTTGDLNSFVGAGAGQFNTTGGSNSFFGRSAGQSNISGNSNTFIGQNAGQSNITGGSNSLVGADAGKSSQDAFNNSFFGRNAGLKDTTGSNNSFIGSSAGFENTTGSSNSFFGRTAGKSNTTGSNNTIIGNAADVGPVRIDFATAIGAQAVVRNNNTIVLGREDGSDKVRVFGLGAAGSTRLCRNADSEISSCTGSAVDSQDEATLTTLREQNAQILEQQMQIARQQRQIDEMKKLVCSLKPEALLCKDANK